MDDGKKDSESNQSTEQRGIFSTPELTVNTENLPQNQPVKPAGPAARFNFGRRANRGGNASSSERVASAFAQTDASQQSQRLNEAMLENANAATQSTATGDIQLDVPKKRKKWPWAVIAGILLLLTLGGVTAFFLLNSSVSNAQSLRLAYTEYYDYAKYGPSEDDDTTASKPTSGDEPETYFLFTLSNSNMSEQKKQNYANTLQEKYTTFLNKLLTVDPEIEGASHDAVIKRAQLDSKLLHGIISASLLDLLSNELLNVYIGSGSSGAYTFIQENTLADSGVGSLASLSEDLDQYLSNQLDLFEIYDSRGCIIGIAVSAVCRDELATSNDAYDTLLSQQESISERIMSTLSSVQQMFYFETEEFANALGVNNE